VLEQFRNAAAVVREIGHERGDQLKQRHRALKGRHRRRGRDAAALVDGAQCGHQHWAHVARECGGGGRRRREVDEHANGAEHELLDLVRQPSGDENEKETGNITKRVRSEIGNAIRRGDINTQ
jgi:hypothetical protein